MKTRLASSLVVTAALALGATGCGLIAPQATTEPYAPSDGVELNVGDVLVRNILLIADETGESFNVVFTSVNDSGEDQSLAINFAAEGASGARAEFDIPSGTTAFGDPEGDETPVLVAIGDVEPGQTVEAYFQVPGSEEESHRVPVLDGTLAEYQAYVLPAGFGEDEDEDDELVGIDEEETEIVPGKTSDDASESEEAAAAE